MHARSPASAPSRGAVASATVPPRGVPAVTRAIAVLDRLAEQREPMTLARLAQALELPKSSVHGLCSTLVSYGYLHRQEDGAFRIGPKVMSLAEAFVAGTDVAREFNALWTDAAPDETIVLSVLSGAEVLYIGVRHGAKPLGLAFNVGMKLPAHLAATGKAMLAQRPPQAVRALLGAGPLARMAAAGPRRLAELAKELDETRERGFSVDDEGVRAGVYCIGAPIFDAHGEAIAAIGVCLNKAMLGRDGGARHRRLVLQSAAVLTQRLGGSVPPPTPDAPAAPRRRGKS